MGIAKAIALHGLVIAHHPSAKATLSSQLRARESRHRQRQYHAATSVSPDVVSE